MALAMVIAFTFSVFCASLRVRRYGKWYVALACLRVTVCYGTTDTSSATHDCDIP